MESKKETFKILIKEFHEFNLPEIVIRDLKVPQQTNKVITITGSRRVGKTFYFYQLINEIKISIPLEQILYLSFEDDRILPLSFKELDDLLEAYFELYPENKSKMLYLFFDEIQNVNGWEIFIRRIYDKENVQIFLTGSSSKLLSREIATSLRGRTLSYHLFPLSFQEFLRFRGLEIKPDFEYSNLRFNIKSLLEEFILFGGFPEVVLEEKGLKFKILKNYYDLLIYKDLAERFSVRNIRLLKDLMKFLITNIAASFSTNSYHKSIEQELRVSRETIMEYLSHIEEIELVYLLPIFAYSLKVQQVNPKKIYSLDNGIRNAVAFKFSQDEGRLVENLVFQEIKRRELEVYYWKKKGEVDFVIKKDDKLIGINVSYGNEIKDREERSLLELKNEFGERVQCLILITKDVDEQKNDINLIPLWKWLLEENGNNCLAKLI
ncbi:MAG: ATP-binding protein [Nitrospirota bacterium]